MSEASRVRTALRFGWYVAIAAALGVRLWNALAGPLLWGYDAWGHVAYVLFIDLYRGVPWADQGWSYFHPPLHYLLAWPLAWAGSGAVLARGLALLSSAASLGTAVLAAALTRSIAPRLPGLALLAFGAVAFLPVHLVVSAMPTNELTYCFLGSAAVALFIADERRERPTATRAAATGAVLGLAFLAKFSALVPLAAIVASLAARAFLSGPDRRALAAAVARGALILGVALAVCGPYYLRNVIAFGTPFQKSSDFPLVGNLEARQAPGVRTWRDYVALPPRLFTEPDPLAPHLLHSVWGSAYTSAWADTHRESDTAHTPEQRRRELRPMSVMVVLGIAPTALFLFGTVLAVRDVRYGARRAAYVPLLALTAATLLAFALFVWIVPRFAAAKASYLLTLSLPFAVFLARAVEFLWQRPLAWQRIAAPAVLAGVAFAACVVGTAGAVLPRRADAPGAGALHFYFGEYDEARRIFGRLANGAEVPLPWLDNLAGVEIADGHPERALRLYGRAVDLAGAHGLSDPYRSGRYAVALALTGDLQGADAALSAALEAEPIPELLANRGAIRAAEGDLAAAARDLRAALALEPAMVPARLDLARVLAASGLALEARDAQRLAAEAACRVPRGYPYGLGTGEILEWGVGRRWLLLYDGQGLRVALPSFYRGACESLRASR